MQESADAPLLVGSKTTFFKPPDPHHLAKKSEALCLGQPRVDRRKAGRGGRPGRRTILGIEYGWRWTAHRENTNCRLHVMIDICGILSSYSRLLPTFASWCFCVRKEALVSHSAAEPQPRLPGCAPAEARSAIFDYIECFYNRTRLHSSLGTSVRFSSKPKSIRAHHPKPVSEKSGQARPLLPQTSLPSVGLSGGGG
jgi:hypothetical protein